MEFTIKNEIKTPYEQAYYRQRLKNRVYEKLVSFLSEQCNSRKITKKDLAFILDRDPSSISRWLRAPSNLTLDTISDLLLAVDAEPEPMGISLFSECRAPNYVHPLISKVTHKTAEPLNIKPNMWSSGSVEYQPTAETLVATTST